MAVEQNPIDYIISQLKTKSCTKQETYRNLLSVFEGLKKSAKALAAEVAEKTKDIDKGVTIEYKEGGNDQEFHLKVAGDLLIFVMHTNIIAFNPEHAISKSRYVLENPERKYFGQIMIYNFMSDSVKYNRESDPGYLLARVLVNFENRFFVEGEGQLGFLFKDISANVIGDLDLEVLTKVAVTIAIENDLVVPPYPEVKFLTLGQKNHKTHDLGAGSKIGFQMSYQKQEKGH